MAKEQLDDLMDTRAKIRALKKAVIQTKAAYDAAKSDLADATAAAEEILIQIEQRQGRLPFEPEAPSAPGAAKRKRTKRGKSEQPDARSQAV